MRYLHLTVIAVVLTSTAICAESQSERELAVLKEIRDKAIAAATEPINRRHQASLEQLLRRATQAGDLAAAVKIKAEMEGGEEAAAAPAATDMSPRTVRKALSGAWNWDAKNLKSWGAFKGDGNFHMESFDYEVKIFSNGTVTFLRNDRKKGPSG